jgi:hypothetical protein
MEKLNKKVMKDLYDRDTRENEFYAVEDSDALNVAVQELPDAKLHQRISFIKSAIRLGACAFGFFGFFELGFILLFLAEIVGIGEELV